MHIDLPQGAIIAAERAYVELPREHRRDAERVARAILTAAAPFMAPAVAQLGRCRINQTGAADIFHRWLCGERPRDIAARYAVTPQTINRHIERGRVRARARVAGGVPVAVIAMEHQVPVPSVQFAIEMREASHAA